MNSADSHLQTKITEGSRKGNVYIEIVSKNGFRFLDLHSEIRIQIYKMLFVKPDPIPLATFRRKIGVKVVTGTSFDDAKMHPGRVWDQKNLKWTGDLPNELSLLRVNTQIYCEATPIVYGENRFIQGSSTAFIHFAPTIGPDLNFLTALDFGEACTRFNMRETFVALKGATGLRTLQFSLSMVYDSYAGKRHMRIARCAQYLANDLMALLLCLQASYKAERRTWKAVDVVRIRGHHTAAPLGKALVLLCKSEVKEFQAMIRKVTNVYLKEE